MLGKVFARFVEKSPISVMVRGTLERVLGAEQLDAWFARTCAITGYQPVADSGHGAWRLSLLWHFPLDLVLYLRYTTSISLSLLDAARRYHGTPV